jgi:hypothetical protein
MNPFTKVGERLIAAFKAIKISHAIGGFDISINEHLTGDFPAHWRPHTWIFLRKGELSRKGEKELRDQFPNDPLMIPKPVMIKRFDRNLAAIAYALKGDFQRRVTLPRSAERDGSTKTRRNVRYRHLRARQKVELLLMLDRVGLEGRVFAYGMRVAQRGGKPRIIVMTRPTRTTGEGEATHQE